MSASSLYQELLALGVVLTPHGEDGLTIEGPAAIAWPAWLPRIREVKQELRRLAMGTDRFTDQASDNELDTWEGFGFFPDDHPFAIANEVSWSNIDAGDRRYLTFPRTHPEPCLCCGGRLIHSRACRMMREAGLGVETTRRRR